MKCPKCKIDNPDDSQFCKKCGTSLIDIPVTLTSPPPEKEGAPKTPALDFAPGQYFGKRYQIIEEIGRGGMGRVYKALDKELNRTVALKMIKPEISSHPGIVERFKKEIKLASQITHENVCRIHDLGEYKGIKYISMQFIEGNNLHEFIQASKRLNIDTAINITEQICRALTAAHKKGVIHRDLKPQNIMLDKKGKAYVMDFGIARSLEAEEVTKPGVVIGTPHYMSPEQAEGKAVDTISAIYSLGCILYEMLTGKPPFEADTSAALIHKHLKEKPQSPSKLNPQISSALEQIILKCLEKEPEKRYQGADEIIKAMDGAKPEFMPAAKPAKIRWKLYIPIAAIILIGMVIGFYYIMKKEKPPIPLIQTEWKYSIAVLPFEDLSPQKDQEYFSDSMTDALISNLAKISALRVISRTSVMQYKRVKKTLPEIAQELNIDAVVEGTALRAGERVRVTAQLIEVRTDRHLWVESYERDLSDILALQSEVAQAIAREIKITLTPEEEVRLASSRPVNPEAHDAYLKGAYYYAKGTDEGFKKAIEYFEQAIEKDPNYAPAHVFLASIYISLHFYSGYASKDAFPKAKASAMKALEIDETFADAHSVLAHILAFYDWDWSAAEREYKIALELNPGLAQAHSRYSWFLIWMGRFEEAISEGRKATELDPLSRSIIRNMGRFLYFARRYDESIEQLQRVVEMHPNYFYPYIYLGLSYEQKGLYKEAIAAFQKAVSLWGSTYHIGKSCLASAYALSGGRDEALKILKELKELEKRIFVPPTAIARIHLGLGDKEQAINWLEKAYEARDGDMVLLRVWPQWDPLQSDPRFQALLKRMNFPEN